MRTRPRVQNRRIDSLVTAHAVATTNRPALTFEGVPVNYAALDRTAAAMAGWLTTRGIGPGDRVAIYTRNHPESFVTLLAVSRLGAMMVPLNWRLSEAELSWQMADAAPTLLIHAPEFAEMACRLADQSACPRIALGTELEAARDGHGLAEADLAAGGAQRRRLARGARVVAGGDGGKVAADAVVEDAKLDARVAEDVGVGRPPRRRRLQQVRDDRRLVPVEVMGRPQRIAPNCAELRARRTRSAARPPPAARRAARRRRCSTPSPPPTGSRRAPRASAPGVCCVLRVARVAASTSRPCCRVAVLRPGLTGRVAVLPCCGLG